MSFDEIQIQNFMEQLGQMSGGDVSREVSMYEIGGSMGLDRPEAGALAEELIIDGYAEFHNRLHNPSDGPKETQRRVTLIFEDPDANSVAVVGSFNGWSPANSNMRKNEFGKWEISVYLPPGRYTYRFLVNNSFEVVDPASSGQEPDGYGGRNSVLFVQ